MSKLIEKIIAGKIACFMRVASGCPDVDFSYLREWMLWAQEKFPSEYKSARHSLIWSDALDMDNHPIQYK